MSLLAGLIWQPARWCRNGFVATLTLLGFIALYVGPNSEGEKAVLAAAIAALAFVNLGFRDEPLDRSLCKLAPVVLVGAVAASVLWTETTNDRHELYRILLEGVRVFSFLFAMQFMLANWVSSVRWQYKNKRCNSQ